MIPMTYFNIYCDVSVTETYYMYTLDFSILNLKKHQAIIKAKHRFERERESEREREREDSIQIDDNNSTFKQNIKGIMRFFHLHT